jgi:hypothetical protein
VRGTYDQRPEAAARTAGATPPALTLLRVHADQGLTGELLLQGQGGFVRVYLQRGRVAWASDSRHRHGFTTNLKALARIDDGAVEAVVDGCRRTRRPIGEALASSGLATHEQVREALRSQIATALALATTEPRPRASFVGRPEYASYDPYLTFAVAELLSGDGSVREALPR